MLSLFAIYLFAVSQCTAQELVNPCLDTKGPYSQMPWCDATLPIDVRVDDMISRMNLTEKIATMNTMNQPIGSLGLPLYNWWSEATSGVASDNNRITTKFAFPITTGMSFNRTLWEVTGRQIAKEARALMNAGDAYSTFWAPVINLAREPRWGRNIETPGEDPMLTGEYAEYFVKGFQEAPEDPYHLQASACCKHYAANSMDGTTEKDGEHHDRNHVDVKVTMQDLVDSYLKPFQACVEKGRVSSLMCSYNAINGVPSCANNWLLQTVARENWGFDGYITSDCDADSDVYNSHHYTDTPEESVRDVLRAGTDIDCGGFVSSNAQSALNEGLITEDDLDERLRKLFRVRMRLSHFDPIGPLDEIPQSVVCSQESEDLSMEGLRQSVTMLKNDNDALPWDANKMTSVAVIGPNANLSKSVSGYYGPSRVCGGNFWTLADAIKKGSPQVSVDTLLGVDNVLSNDMSKIPQAVHLAKKVDQVVLAVGTDLSWAREGMDAASIAFTDAQKSLVKRVAAAAKNPVVVVIFTATPLDISSLLSNPNIGAILHVGQPSVTIYGLDDILYGRVSPAGRMIQTIYPESYQDQISIFDFNMRPGPSTFARPDCTNKDDPSQCPRGINPGRTHRFYTGKSVVKFGYGLSYSSFSYKDNSEQVVESKRAISLAPLRQLLAQTKSEGFSFVRTEHHQAAMAGSQWLDDVSFSVNVTNTGKMDADEVVLGFLTPPGAGQNGVPLQTLFGFQRVHVPAGETVTVTLYPEMTDFAQVDKNGQLYAHEGTYRVHFGIESENNELAYLRVSDLQAL